MVGGGYEGVLFCQFCLLAKKLWTIFNEIFVSVERVTSNRRLDVGGDPDRDRNTKIFKKDFLPFVIGKIKFKRILLIIQEILGEILRNVFSGGIFHWQQTVRYLCPSSGIRSGPRNFSRNFYHCGIGVTVRILQDQ